MTLQDFINRRLSVWDMEAEHLYWQGVAARSGCPSEQFAFRWALMKQIYSAAEGNRRLSMEDALTNFISHAAEAGADEDVARLIFSRTWARIVTRTTR